MQAAADKASQVSFDGQSLADLRECDRIAAERAATERSSPTPSTPTSRAATPQDLPPGDRDMTSCMNMMRGIACTVGLQAVARRKLLEGQLSKLAELRLEVITKLDSRQVKESLIELRKYRRPPRAAAQVRHGRTCMCGTRVCPRDAEHIA